jgi:GTP cyclohydrolase II
VSDKIYSADDTSKLERVSINSLRTRYYGLFTAHGFKFHPTNEEILVLTLGDLATLEAPLVRIHSRCLTGDVFGSILCECGQQIEIAFEKMYAEGAGIFIYLEQEGRGAGLLAKLKAEELAETEGLDTVDAYLKLGIPVDGRSYDTAVQILNYLGVRKVRLLTNNPNKIKALTQAGIEVIREPIEITPNPWNRDYLHVKKLRMGHLFAYI